MIRRRLERVGLSCRRQLVQASSLKIENGRQSLIDCKFLCHRCFRLMPCTWIISIRVLKKTQSEDLKELCRQRDLQVGRSNGDCNDLESNSPAEADRIKGGTSGSEAGDDKASGCVKRAI